jgi:hypothetical protein
MCRDDLFSLDVAPAAVHGLLGSKVESLDKNGSRYLRAKTLHSFSEDNIGGAPSLMLSYLHRAWLKCWGPDKIQGKCLG